MDTRAHAQTPIAAFQREFNLKAASLPLLFAAFLALPVAFAHDSPHEHGVVHLDVAVEGRRIILLMESPLDNLLGFERAPRDVAERRRADAAVAKLKAADKLFAIDGAAQCKLTKVELSSAALKLGPAAEPGADGHADIDGSFEFDCAGRTMERGGHRREDAAGLVGHRRAGESGRTGCGGARGPE